MWFLESVDLLFPSYYFFLWRRCFLTACFQIVAEFDSSFKGKYFPKLCNRKDNWQMCVQTQQIKITLKPILT